ncbi:MAG: hypothetical protein AAB373_01090 [Patescibacteria group bacterium]
MPAEAYNPRTIRYTYQGVDLIDADTTEESERDTDPDTEVSESNSLISRLTRSKLARVLALTLSLTTGTFIYGKTTGFNDEPRTDVKSQNNYQLDDLRGPGTTGLLTQEVDSLTCMREKLNDLNFSTILTPKNKWAEENCAPEDYEKLTTDTEVVAAKDRLLRKASFTSEPKAVTWYIGPDHEGRKGLKETINPDAKVD